jgi:DNA-binding response OmpR family regulator
MNILIIDDDIDASELLKTFMEQNSHKVLQAYTAKDGLRELLSKKPDAVFLDILLPDASGLDLLKEIKTKDRQTPIIMVTGFKDAENVVRAFREGAFDCLLKPYNYDYLKTDILGKISPKAHQ